MLNIYNTLTRKTEPFKPIENGKVKMYTCGPSTYQPAHIGNYRTFLFEDILQRYLEYSGYKVTRLITLTDVEDKAIAQAKKENLPLEKLTSQNEKKFFQDFQHLRIKKPDYTIRASTAIDQAATLTKTLIQKGYAYWHTHNHTKNAYYNPQKFHNFGKLAHLNMKQWPTKKRRFHLDTYPGTPWNHGDFILWHGCTQGEACFKTEIGNGRPAWNIQDAAIITKHLGFTIDVACGGADNLVRHHDYTIAVAEAVSGKNLARYWLHGAHLLVNGKKMSKSKGNVLHPDDLTAKGFRKDQVRFFLIYGHYRKKLNFTPKKLAETSQRLDKFKAMIQQLKNAESPHPSPKARALVDRLTQDFEAEMDNDLDVKAAFERTHQTVTRLYRLMEQGKLSAENAEAAINALRQVDTVLQVLF